MDIFTYLMSKKGKNYLSHKNDLFAYLLGRSTNKYFYQTFTGITLSVDNTLNAPMRIKLNASEMSQSGTPTPESPQDIHTISGDNTIVVCGANIWNEQWENGGINNNTGAKETASGFIRTKDYTSIEASTTYYRTPSPEATRIFFYTENKTYISNVPVEADGGTFTTPNNAKYLLFKQYNTTYNNDIAIIKGDSGTYEPYQEQTAQVNLGDLEYCKIGNYEDKIFKNIPVFTEYDNTLVEGAWYIKKNIGKVVLDGSETGGRVPTVTTGDYRFYVDIGSNIYSAAPNVIAPFYCNKFKAISRNNSYNKIEGIAPTDSSFNYKSLIIYSDLTKNMTFTEFQNWLSTHNTIVYYPLATPTYTQITGTLAEQLENIYQKLKSFKGTTNISQVNNDLPFILHCEIAMKNY